MGGHVRTLVGVVQLVRLYFDGPTPGYPLDRSLALGADKNQFSLLSLAVRLASRTSFEEAHEILGWFVPEAPSIKAIRQAALGMGAHGEACVAHGQLLRDAPWQESIQSTCQLHHPLLTSFFISVGDGMGDLVTADLTPPAPLSRSGRGGRRRRAALASSPSSSSASPCSWPCSWPCSCSCSWTKSWRLEGFLSLSGDT